MGHSNDNLYDFDVRADINFHFCCYIFISRAQLTTLENYYKTKRNKNLIWHIINSFTAFPHWQNFQLMTVFGNYHKMMNIAFKLRSFPNVIKPYLTLIHF